LSDFPSAGFAVAVAEVAAAEVAAAEVAAAEVAAAGVLVTVLAWVVADAASETVAGLEVLTGDFVAMLPFEIILDSFPPLSLIHAG
jgi:hypothetical protein